jgi:HlyD family secretion protein
MTVMAMVLGMSACGKSPAPAWSGYAEGDHVYVAAPLAGRLQTLSVQAGQQVTRGAALFVLDAEAESAARDEAAARLAAARAQAADASKGRRGDEVAVTQAQLAQARAQAELSRSDLARQQQLVEQGFISKARLDDARTAVAQSQARLTELEANLRVAKLPARTDALEAAQAQAEAASQALRQSAWRAEQKQQRAPADALVAEVFFRQGEYVAAGQPVVSLLPPGHLKARFFVSEIELGSIAVGQRVTLHCDGCGAPIEARISRIASQPEYTPPVIYSNAQRAKLVFMVEAQPGPKDAVRLHPGQPLDVRRTVGGAP